MRTATIWKYAFEVVDRFTLQMPVRAAILSVDVQHEMPCMWALVSPNAGTETRSFAVFGTGHPLPEDGEMRFIGTFMLHGGSLVFHLFEVVDNSTLSGESD